MSAFSSLALVAVISVADLSSLVATKVIPAGDAVTASNAETSEGAPPESAFIGREVKRTVYVGQEISLDDTRSPRLVTRNQVVTVKYIKGSLEITTTGRAMNDASADEAVTVLNAASRQLIHGIVQKNGSVLVQ